MVSLVGAKDRVFWYLSDLTSRVVAETGIPSDMYHLGKVILRSLKDAPDFVLQIDAATGKSETFQSVLERSVRCALSLKKMGFKCGDVLAVIAPYYLELAVLYYAALYLGIKIAVMDPVLDDSGVKEMLQVYRANIIFSQNSKIPIVKEAMNQIDLIAKLVSFEDEDGSDVISFAKFIEKCGDVDVYAFKPTDFDPAVTTATIMPSSGTTGAPKVVDSTHKNYLSSIPYYWANVGSKLPTPFETHFRTTSVQGVTSIIAQVCAPIIRFTNIQTSAGYSVENHIDVINEYRPQTMVLSPIEILSIIKPVMKKKADLTCFKTILVGGSPVPQKLFRELKKIAPKVALLEGFGATEISGFIFWRPAFSKSFGRPMGCYDVRLVDPETLKDITEPHVTGELWVKGHGVAKGYYNNPIDTKAAFLPDGWFRTGDLFYRDEQFSFYYVDRLKLLLKYKTFHVSTVDIENVILEYPGVLDVVVVGIPDWECGDLPAACIVPHPDNPPTAQGVKDFVKDKLSDAKQLRGGVLFMEEFPLTVNLKVDRIKLKEIALTAKRE